MRYYFASGIYLTKENCWGTISCCLSLEKFSAISIIEEFEKLLKSRGIELFSKVNIISITRLTKKEYNEAKEYEEEL